MKHLLIMKFSLDVGVWELGFTYRSLVPTGKGSSWQCLVRPNSGDAKILLEKEKNADQSAPMSDQPPSPPSSPSYLLSLASLIITIHLNAIKQIQSLLL